MWKDLGGKGTLDLCSHGILIIESWKLLSPFFFSNVVRKDG